MKTFIVLPVLSLLLFISGCSSTINVAYDYDKSVDFSQYETFEYYGWAEESDKVLNQFDKERFEKAVGNELSDRGMEYVRENGDLIVSLYVVVDKKTSVTAYTDHYGMGAGRYGYPLAYGPGWGWGYGASTTTYQEHDYLVGTLIIDVFDKDDKRLVWQGVGSKTVDENPRNREKNISEAVAAIMANYPVSPMEAE